MIQLYRTNSEHPEFVRLTGLLDDALCMIYNTRKEDYEEYNRITGLPTVVLAMEENVAVACGCFKMAGDSTIELKRMFVDPAFRSQGIASAIVGELEKWAKENDCEHAILETGKGQPEAIALYAKLGYSMADDSDFASSERSVCMKKKL
ncbi:GNAT family N-acetyltransferase [Dyadobacter sediminis]|uniref:GNAT family N-acetyltransferase n=1 Tax=Dyadobacter sediminis TaxID=1493691 RepID=A0A5R9K5K7_9BACT|nr:GNAT family N-acetyltransferase [Dyadobacter sediminis]TLU88835.1 GNAT family N-acetyltransferase [Dyadobacter sediminis]GGC13551.1 N-acetyltransferase [Dyadobacter sediminis]